MTARTSGPETILSFATSSAAWAAMRKLDAAGFRAGYPNLDRLMGVVDVRVASLDRSAVVDAVRA